MKKKLVTAPVLTYPDYEKQFVVCTGSSTKALGASLSQLDDNSKEESVHFANSVLSGIEVNYSSFERKFLSVIFALKKFQHICLSTKFKLYTNLQTLKYVFYMKKSHKGIAHCFSLLVEYDFEIFHQAGKQNVSADYLFRPIGVLMVLEDQYFETNLRGVVNYLHSPNIIDSATRNQMDTKLRKRFFC